MNDQTLLAIQTSVATSLESLRTGVKADVDSIRKEVKDDINSIKKDISSINTEIAKINVTLDEDHKKIVGNGKKGLVDRVTKLEDVLSSGGYIYRTIISFIAWIVATGLAIFAVIYK